MFFPTLCVHVGCPQSTHRDQLLVIRSTKECYDWPPASLQCVCVRVSPSLRNADLPSQHCSNMERDDSMSCYKRDVGMKFGGSVGLRYGHISNKMSERELRFQTQFCMRIVLRNFQDDRASLH